MNVFPAFASRRRPAEDELLAQSVGSEGERLRATLAATVSAHLSEADVRNEVQGNLWMLAPESFRYFLPAFMTLAVEHYDSLGHFAAELVSALTEPSREAVEESLERVAEIPGEVGLAPDVLRQLREQQLEWYDSGSPLTTYRERVDDLSPSERDAISSFLIALRDGHGDDFPFGELQIAIDQYRPR